MTQGREAFYKTLTKAHFGFTANVTPVVGSWVRLGTYTVRPQETVSFGYGSEALPENQGYLFIDIRDAAAAPGAILNGEIRLAQVNAFETELYVAHDERTEVLRGHLTDRKLKIPFPEQVQLPLVGEDSRLIVEVLMDTTAVIGWVNSTLMIPVTIYL